MSVISIGTFCISADLIGRAGLRRAAYPFDWLFSSVAATIDIIDSDFGYFLDPAFLNPLPSLTPPYRCMHSRYDGDNPNLPTFNHRDPTRPEDHAYYDRCIARFRSDCAKGATLLMFGQTGEIEDGFDDLRAVVDRRYPMSSLRAVRHVPGELSVERTKTLGRHELWRLGASPVVEGVRLERPEDEAALMRAVCPTPVGHLQTAPHVFV